MTIAGIRAWPTSFPVPPEKLGINPHSPPYRLAADGTGRPLEAPGIGVDIDEKFLERHPVIEGPGYV